jgi:hypothetical protein
LRDFRFQRGKPGHDEARRNGLFSREDGDNLPYTNPQ